MVRAAAKNHPSVAVVVDPSSYREVLDALAAGGFTFEQRRALASQGLPAHGQPTTLRSRRGSPARTTEVTPQDGFPSFLGCDLEARRTSCGTARTRTRRRRCTSGAGGDSLATAEQLHGKQMSYNNYVDTDAALRAANDFSAPTVAIIKHANPCGIASADDVAEAHRKAHACDSVSAFGGVIAVNRPVSVAMAEQVAEIFTEVIVAPATRTARSRCCPASPRSGSCRPPAVRAVSTCGRSAAACCCRAPTRSTPRATTRRAGRSPAASRWPT